MPSARLAAATAMVIGVGAGGRQVALQLAAMGVPRLVLVDFDRVEVENLAPQGYLPSDLGRLKVDATAEMCARILPELRIRQVAAPFRRSHLQEAMELGGELVVFLCVDSIEARRLIFEMVLPVAQLVLDGRMSAEVLRVLAVEHPLIDSYYVTTLFAAEEAFHGACTARSTIYMAAISAGLMVGQFARYLRGIPVIRDQVLNLLAAELTVPD